MSLEQPQEGYEAATIFFVFTSHGESPAPKQLYNGVTSTYCAPAEYEALGYIWEYRDE